MGKGRAPGHGLVNVASCALPWDSPSRSGRAHSFACEPPRPDIRLPVSGSLSTWGWLTCPVTPRELSRVCPLDSRLDSRPACVSARIPLSVFFGPGISPGPNRRPASPPARQERPPISFASRSTHQRGSSLNMGIARQAQCSETHRPIPHRSPSHHVRHCRLSHSSVRHRGHPGHHHHGVSVAFPSPHVLHGLRSRSHPRSQGLCREPGGDGAALGLERHRLARGGHPDLLPQLDEPRGGSGTRFSSVPPTSEVAMGRAVAPSPCR